ncbi:hypothetical protein BD309DRAFT_658223 [Dichomitus squalens]|uniref:Uncharacterized protein n=1 Tax=Dichomitus squalens TaxID=114155 RepID=A0A4Q9NC67_9APHY|nr:hypothetical protein BD311DRAFT_554249 [Dichomitus squalens]TBU37092.1 hypothetical protein BD309DRAFT_658223 [Dichomitus squalens]TBU60279.1 hypothetical protein BD310DRAFT_339568 [Dichomitus squalens]
MKGVLAHSSSLPTLGELQVFDKPLRVAVLRNLISETRTAETLEVICVSQQHNAVARRALLGPYPRCCWTSPHGPPHDKDLLRFWCPSPFGRCITELKILRCKTGRESSTTSHASMASTRSISKRISSSICTAKPSASCWYTFHAVSTICAPSKSSSS